MKPLELKGARTRLGFNQQYMADRLNMALPTYCNKENGKSEFSDEQKVLIAKILGWKPHQMNEYLYDGVLPIGCDAENCPVSNSDGS